MVLCNNVKKNYHLIINLQIKSKITNHKVSCVIGNIKRNNNNNNFIVPIKGPRRGKELHIKQTFDDVIRLFQCTN